MPCRAAPRRRAVCSCCVRGRERDRRRGRSGSCGRPPRPCAAASSRRFGDGHKAHQARRAGRRALGCQRIFALLRSSSSSTPIYQRFRAANTATACMWIQVAGYFCVARMCVCKRRISPPIRKPRYGHPTASARSRQSNWVCVKDTAKFWWGCGLLCHGGLA